MLTDTNRDVSVCFTDEELSGPVNYEMDGQSPSLPPDHEGSPVMVSVADKEQTPPSIVNKTVDRKSSNPKRKFYQRIV